MKEKFGGWLVITEASTTSQSSSSIHEEYFDFVVVVSSNDNMSNLTSDDVKCPTSRIENYLKNMKAIQSIITFMCLCFGWLLKQIRLTNTQDKPFQTVENNSQQQKKHSTYNFLPTKYQQVLKDSPSLYRGMISPNLPGVAFIDHFMNETTSSTYLASIWLSTMLYEEMILPSEQQQQRESIQQLRQSSIFRFNDLMMQDLDLDPMRKGFFHGRSIRIVFTQRL